jgi:uroporphyrinogen-III decarboxylase
MHDLIKYLTEFELKLAEEICSHLHPNAMYHHDDWGSQKSTFMSVPMFEDFFLEPYKEVYGFWKAHGVELIIHHADSYAATLVPHMIEMGIDIWQGPMTSNNIPELIKKYGSQISFMGGLDSAQVDFPGWTREIIANEVKRACDENGKLFFIPNATQGDIISTYQGVYETITEEIDKYSKIAFKTL